MKTVNRARDATNPYYLWLLIHSGDETHRENEYDSTDYIPPPSPFLDQIYNEFQSLEHHSSSQRRNVDFGKMRYVRAQAAKQRTWTLM